MAETLPIDKAVKAAREAGESLEKEPWRWRIVGVQPDCITYQDEDGKLLFVPAETQKARPAEANRAKLPREG